MKLCLLLFLYALCFPLMGQDTEEVRFLSGKSIRDTAPEDLLAGRTAVLFGKNYSPGELEEIQSGFQQIGIDAVCYSETEKALAGKDLMNAFGRYYKSRSIRFILFLSKENDDFSFRFIPFNARSGWIDAGQAVWLVKGSSIRIVLQAVYRALIGSQKKQNFLVNDYPERNGPNTSIAARREEDWAPGVRALKIAVPRFGNSTQDLLLETFLKENLKASYELVAPDKTEKELLDQNFIYVLRFIHSRGNLAKEILGYDLSKTESAQASVTYNQGILQLKTIPSDTAVYKFYLKQIEDDIYYFGTKWDADTAWSSALKNYLDGYRAAGKLP